MFRRELHGSLLNLEQARCLLLKPGERFPSSESLAGLENGILSPNSHPPIRLTAPQCLPTSLNILHTPITYHGKTSAIPTQRPFKAARSAFDLPLLVGPQLSQIGRPFVK